MDRMPKLIAHRGGKFWEGSDFSYITEAIRAGADIIELDIRLCGSLYCVQHSRFSPKQGLLKDALKRIEGKGLYLDVKDKRIDILDLYAYVRNIHKGEILVGTWYYDMSQRLRNAEVTRIYHCFAPLVNLNHAQYVHADWITPTPYGISKRKVDQILSGGFKFVPGGNLFFRNHECFSNQLRYAEWGAYALSAHRIAKLKGVLESKYK